MQKKYFMQALAWLAYVVVLFLFIRGLGAATVPLLIAFVLAYLFFPVVKWVEKYRVSRTVAILTSFTIAFLAFIMMLALVIPRLVRDMKSFAQEFPNKVVVAAERIEQIAGELGYHLQINSETVREFLIEKQSLVSTQLIGNIGSQLFHAVSGVTGWLLAVMSYFLIPLFFYYLIHDFEKMLEKAKQFVPEHNQEKAYYYMTLIDQILSGYIRGQLSVAGILAVLYGLGLTLIGLQFGFVIGLIAGFLSVIPYVGFTFGFITALAVALANGAGIGVVVGVCVVFGTVQALEGTIITPKLVGDKVGLSPLVTILVLIIGGNLAGLLGMLVAIPMAAIIKVLLSELRHYLWQQS